MALLTEHGTQIVNDIAQRYGLSNDAVQTLLVAVNNGGGTQAQFSHPEVGGMGQWSMGGMVMVGDMFNNGLKFTVDQVCTELSNALANGQLFAPVPARQFSGQMQSQGSGASFSVQGGFSGGSRWPAELGVPSSTGSQNNLHYAVFPDTRRLAIDLNGQVTVYDIGDHQIGGFSQQQSGDQSITFTSQYGTVRVADLPVVTPGGQSQQQPQPAAPSFQASDPAPAPAPAAPAETQAPSPAPAGQQDIFALIEQLAGLRDKGILSDSEFETKKAELLSRL